LRFHTGVRAIIPWGTLRTPGEDPDAAILPVPPLDPGGHEQPGAAPAPPALLPSYSVFPAQLQRVEAVLAASRMRQEAWFQAGWQGGRGGATKGGRKSPWGNPLLECNARAHTQLPPLPLLLNQARREEGPA